MKLTQQEKFEAEQRRAALREFIREIKEYERNLHKGDKFGFKTEFKFAGPIFSILFAFLFICSVSMIFL